MTDNADFYEAFAPWYEDIYRAIDAGETVRQWVELLETNRLVPPLPERRRRPPRLVDVGCGPGWYLAPWSQAGFEVTGLDSSPEMLRRARSRVCRAQGISEADALPRLVMLDIRRPDPALHRRPFDIAVSHFNFIHLFGPEDVRGVLCGIWGLMNPGSIWVFDLYLPSPSELQELHVKEHYSLAQGGEAVRSARYLPRRNLVVQDWSVPGGTFKECFWLHSLEQLTHLACEGGWHPLGIWSWMPEDLDHTFSLVSEGIERAVVVLRRS